MKYNYHSYDVGPLTAKLFSKMQTMLQYCTEGQRYEALFNLLKMMKETDLGDKK